MYRHYGKLHLIKVISFVSYQTVSKLLQDCTFTNKLLVYKGCNAFRAMRYTEALFGGSLIKCAQINKIGAILSTPSTEYSFFLDVPRIHR